MRMRQGLVGLLTLYMLASVFVTGCASQPPAPKPDLGVVSESLAVEANSVYSEIKRLNASHENGSSNVTILKTVTGCSTRMVSMDFDGGLQLFLNDLEKSGLCKVRVLGC